MYIIFKKLVIFRLILKSVDAAAVNVVLNSKHQWTLSKSQMLF